MVMEKDLSLGHSDGEGFLHWGIVMEKDLSTGAW
jgi:hypothetical protein